MITEFKMDKQFIESALGLNRGHKVGPMKDCELCNPTPDPADILRIYEEAASQLIRTRIPLTAVASIPPRATLCDSLDRAKRALAAQTMTAEDARAWLDLDDMQRELLRTR